ncbi:colicin immunity domain-containing protein [Pseudoalteromonas rubra]|uniref:Colicin D immunity protein domain-containing protein n=1 Tax=Pseudoalteromonas rubra TaxID=43658 RepID=A0A0F4QH66_9GAMM|nr:colicin immunity domain-containing protein [Pseudoalteromonas rubra]KJZ06669.1 hypothetical protein TW77_18425 [Pseudoalteromonas rubra]
MSSIEWLEPYILLVTQFVVGEVTAGQFEASYMDMFKNESREIPDDIYDVLNDLFSDVDAYCGDPDLRGDEDLDELTLLSRAKEALRKLT